MGLADFPAEALCAGAGDLGFALMWIVQAVLVRSLVRNLGDGSGNAAIPPVLADALKSETIGALAHSEDANIPFTFEKRRERLVLNGSKKFITGGMNCDFILLTARRAGEAKVSALIHIPASALPNGSRAVLSLPALRTTSHARLSLSDFTLRAAHLLPLSGSSLRQALRKWSIVERAFILRSYIALCIYMVDRLPRLSDGTIRAELDELLLRQRVLAVEKAHQAAGDERVSESSIELSRLLDIVARIRASLDRAAGDIAPHLLARAPDLGLFELLRIEPR